MITEDTIIVDVLRMDINCASVFMEEGLHCLGCVMSTGETIGEACEVHGLDVNHLLKRLNDYFGADDEDSAAV